MADVVEVLLRYLHIVFAVAWIGAVFYGVAVLRTAMGRVEAAARKETMKKLIPVVIHYVPMVGALTITFGTLLYLYMSQFDVDTLVGTRWGLTILSSLVLTVATFSFGILVVIGGARRLLSHLEEESCTHGPEVVGLQRRFNRGQVAIMALSLVIIALMVAASRGLL